jgi:hypothetical protein
MIKSFVALRSLLFVVFGTTCEIPIFGNIELLTHLNTNALLLPRYQVFQFEVEVHFKNGTESSFLSPDWSTMTWYEKKRLQRPMSFFDNLCEGSYPALNEAYIRHVIFEFKDEVASAALYRHWKVPPEDPPANWGFFDVAKQPMEGDTDEMFNLNLCDDFSASCEDMAQRGLCHDQSQLHRMLLTCRYSCDLCSDTDDIRLGDRLDVVWHKYGRAYTATVREVRKNPTKFYLEWDDFDDEKERFEWMNYVDLRGRGFRIFDQGGDDEETSGGYNEGSDDQKEDDEGDTAYHKGIGPDGHEEL